MSCTVYEKVPELLQLGVGITVLPHAMAHLKDLGLLEALNAAVVRTERILYRTRQGQTLWDTPRGVAAGYDVPQVSIHRGALQNVLVEAVGERLPEGPLVLDAAFDHAEQDADGVTATFRRLDGTTFTVRGDLLVGADGIHSTLRRQLNPDEGTLRWSGLMLWRGSVDYPKLMDGRTIINSGGMGRKFIVYPIGPGRMPDTQLMNWACVIRQAEPGARDAPGRESWNREPKLETLLPILEQFDVPEIDIVDLVKATPVFWDFPMCDRDPLTSWSSGRLTLMGDAAHPMFPFGANGAAQAILDAEALARHLGAADAIPGIAAYEAEPAWQGERGGRGEPERRAGTGDRRG